MNGAAAADTKLKWSHGSGFQQCLFA